MCVEDLIIGMRTKVTYLGALAGSTSVPRNPRRIGFQVANFKYVHFRSPNGLYYLQLRSVDNYPTFSATVNTAVRPGTDTVTGTNSNNDPTGTGKVIHVKDYGSWIQEELLIDVSNVVADVWEMIMDPDLETAVFKLWEKLK